MVDAITAKTVTATKPLPADSSAGGSAGASAAAIKAAQTTSQPLNPRLVYDRLAGVVITEFLSQSGNVELQTPSSAVLAYLRVGLGADGHSKYQPEPEKPNPEITYDS
jgi:hypothetical protein